MDIVNKIDKLLLGDEVSGATTTANVAINTAKGHIDVIGGKCPKGQRYDKNKKVCVPTTDESSVVGSMKLSSRKEKSGNFMKTVYTLELPEPIPEFGNTKFSSGSKDQMKTLVKKYGKKYGWSLQETSVVGGSYIGGTTVNIIGSGQTRVWGSYHDIMTDLDRKNKQEIISPDKTIENLGRRGLKFNHVLGAYVPDQWTNENINEEMWQGIKIDGKLKKLLDDMEQGKGSYKNVSNIRKELDRQTRCNECYSPEGVININYNTSGGQRRKEKKIVFCNKCQEIIKRMG